MNTRLKEIEQLIQALHAEKEIIENTEKSQKAIAFNSLLSKCSYYITPYLNVQLLVENKIVEQELHKFIREVSEGYSHFSHPIAPQISFKGDDGLYHIQYDPYIPDYNDTEKVKQEIDRVKGFKEIIKFLKSKGVTKDNFCLERFEEDIDNTKKNLKELEESYEQVKNIIQ